jgi:hypothetical protein
VAKLHLWSRGEVDRLGKGTTAVSIRQLRARLSRLTPSSTAVIGQDRDRDRRRREELRGRKLSATGLTELENAEYLKLKALFHEEDRDHDRLSELSWKEFYAKIGARACES